jgi:anhydro-N-acetylmuramic acid kinase
MPAKNIYHSIGLMSGSSLDGLDICYVEFQISSAQPLQVNYKILEAECVEYDEEFRSALKNLGNASAFEFARRHTELGAYFGKLATAFIKRNGIGKIDLICSHGQTIFHQPSKRFTSQIGCGAQIAAQTNCKVVSDLRSMDVAYGGQGAPVVPVAEKYLFPDHKVFLNIGGIANISFHKDEEVIAYDVCAGNTLLNYFAKQAGFDFDKDGALASKGKIISSLLEELNNIAFCKQPSPKSLGTEHVFKEWLPLFDKYENTTEDKLTTAVEHVAMQIDINLHSKFKIQNSLPVRQAGSLFITGGGAFNSFLVERIAYHSKLPNILPNAKTIQYKEALAMAFIGLLRVLEIPNCLASVTGASKDSIGGAVYVP